MPVTPGGLRKYDHLPPVEAVVKAVTETGPNPDAHVKAFAELANSMPLLHRALLRLYQEENSK